MRNCCGCFVRQIAVGFLLVAGLAASGEGQRPAATPTPSTEAAKPAAASVPQPAAEAIERALALYSDGSAHSSPFVQIYTPAGFATARREAGTVWIQAPQRVRFDYTAPEKKAFTYDAGEGRFFSPEDKQLTVRRLSEDEKACLPVVLRTSPADLAKRYEIQ